ncbi:hypothetical protein VaNZ11_006697, partial [Volvox africanus]
MFRSGIAYTDLTVNSACDELFPGVEDVDAQTTLQLRAALDAFDEGVFEYHNRVAAGASPSETGNKALGGRGQRKTRREQAYANRIPEDRQFFRPVEVQSAEWATFKPHMWLRGRQVHPTEPAPHSHPYAHMHTPPPSLPSAASTSARGSGGSSASAAATVAVASAAKPSGLQAGQAGGELVVQGRKLHLVAPPLGLDVAQGEMLASDGTYEETFVVQYDEWETHVPANLRRRRGRPRDEKAVAIGLPPVEPKSAVLYDIAETLLPELWSRLAPFLAPVLTRMAAERRVQPGGGVKASSAFHAAGGGGGRRGGGEFEILTFSSGDEEAGSGDALVGGSDLALGLGRSPGIDDEYDDGSEIHWPDGAGGGGSDGRFTATAPGGGGGGGDRGPASFHSGGGDSILECESYDSDGEMYRFAGGGGGGGGHGASSPESSFAGGKLVMDKPTTVGSAGGFGRTPPPWPPPVLPRDLLPLDSALAVPPLARGPLLQRPSVPPVVPPPVPAAPSLSPMTSPSQSHPQSRAQSISQTPLPFSQSGEFMAAVAAAAAPPPLAPLAPLQVPPNSISSPQKAPAALPLTQGSSGAQQPPLGSGPLFVVAQQLLAGGLVGPTHTQKHPHAHPPPHPHPFTQAHTSAAAAAAATALQPPSDTLGLMGIMPFRSTASTSVGAASGHSMGLSHPHQHFHSLQSAQPIQPPQPPQPPQHTHQQPPAGAHQPLPRRVPSLGLMSVPPPYNSPNTSTSPPPAAMATVPHTSASGALEVSGTGVPGGGGGGVNCMAQGQSFTVVVGGGGGGGGGGTGGKPVRLGGGGGNASFGPSTGPALTNPLAALAQHSRFLAVPGTGIPVGSAAAPAGAGGAGGGGGGGGGSPQRLRHSGVSGNLAAPSNVAAPLAGLPAACGVVAVGGGTPATAANLTGASGGGAGGPTARSRLPNTASVAAGGGPGHLSVVLAPLTAAPAAAGGTAGPPQLLRQPQPSVPLAQPPLIYPLPLRGSGAGGSSSSTVGAAAAAAAAAGSPAAMNWKASGDMAAPRPSLPLAGLSEGTASISGSYSGSALQQPSLQQHPQQRRSTGSRTSPNRRNSQGLPVQGSAAATASAAAVASPSPPTSLQHQQQQQQQLGTGSVGGAAAAVSLAAAAATGGAGVEAGGGGAILAGGANVSSGTGTG